MIVVGIDAMPLGIAPTQLILPATSVQGHPSGTARDIEDTRAFSALHSIRPIVETLPERPGAGP